MKHFELSEFDCPCGKCTASMDGEFLDALDEARELAGVPFSINSGYRCIEHNKSVGGSKTSSHMLGVAAISAATPSI